MLLAGRAGEDRDRAATLSPAHGERQQPRADEVRGEMLLRDRRVATRPPRAEVLEERHHDLAQERVDRESGEELVERGLGRSVVEVVQARSQPGERLRQLWPPPARALRPVRPDARERQARSLGGGEPLPEVVSHRLNAGFVSLGVEAEAAGRPVRVEEPVAPLPGAQELGADARSPAQFPDPEIALLRLHAHLSDSCRRLSTKTAQYLDRSRRSDIAERPSVRAARNPRATRRTLQGETNPTRSWARANVSAATERALPAPLARSAWSSPGSPRSSAKRRWIGSSKATTASATSALNVP